MVVLPAGSERTPRHRAVVRAVSRFAFAMAARAGTGIAAGIAAAAAAAAAAALSTGATRAAEPPVLLVSPAGFALERGEMVGRFEVEVTKGRLAALPRIPAGWRLKIATGASSGRLEAVCESPSSQFKAEWFTEFLAVSLDPEGQVVLEITTTRDGEKIARRARFSGDRLVLRPAS